MSKAFDDLYMIQQDRRSKANFYNFWLKLAGSNKNIITLEERISIYRWIMEDPEIADKLGTIRARILRSLPIHELHKVIDINDLEKQPRVIRIAIRRRIGL